MLNCLVLLLAFNCYDKRNLMEGVSGNNSAKLSNIAIYWCYFNAEFPLLGVKLIGSGSDLYEREFVAS